MNFFGSLSSRLAELPYLLFVLGITFTLHELAHALTATWLGDNSPRMDGRLSFNPMRHIDLQGFLLMLFVGIGWTSPVNLQESNYRTNNDYTLAVLAGPLMNLILAVLSMFLLPLLGWGTTLLFPLVGSQAGLLVSGWQILSHFLNLFVQVNIFFLIFNLLPLPNLDGFNLWRHLLGNPEWFFNLFGNPLVSLGLFIGIVAGVIPIGLWAYLITRGIMNVILNFLTLFSYFF